MAKRQASPSVTAFVANIFGEDLHEKRVTALSNSVTGVLNSARLAVRAIGRGYAQTSHLKVKHGIKQVDRRLSNAKLDVWQLLPLWVAYIVGVRREIVVALDWTVFAADHHATLCAYLITSHGRATPLLWRTVDTRVLKGRQKAIEHDSSGWSRVTSLSLIL